jgi:hypothetical protein
MSTVAQLRAVSAPQCGATDGCCQPVSVVVALTLCNITKCCTEVCPENIKITDNGIIPMKERVVDVKYDPVRFLRRGRSRDKQP